MHGSLHALCDMGRELSVAERMAVAEMRKPVKDDEEEEESDEDDVMPEPVNEWNTWQVCHQLSPTSYR